MKRTENMTVEELQMEINNQTKILGRANDKIEKIHGHKDYSDYVAEHFHLGMVGFRKDRKKVNRTIERTIKDSTEAVQQYEIRDMARTRIDNYKKAIEYIEDNGGGTVREIKSRKINEALSNAKEIKWEKIKGTYGGTAYQHKEFIVDKVSDGFVAVRQKGELIAHRKTIKEAKAVVSLIVTNKNGGNHNDNENKLC